MNTYTPRIKGEEMNTPHEHILTLDQLERMPELGAGETVTAYCAFCAIDITITGGN